MITVTIFVNGGPVFTRSAVNVTKDIEKKDGKQEHAYRLDDGSIVLHIPDEGAVSLAQSMLETIEEPGADPKIEPSEVNKELINSQ